MFVCIFFFKPPARLLPAASYKDNVLSWIFIVPLLAQPINPEINFENSGGINVCALSRKVVTEEMTSSIILLASRTSFSLAKRKSCSLEMFRGRILQCSWRAVRR